jgi:hypothetical protein
LLCAKRVENIPSTREIRGSFLYSRHRNLDAAVLRATFVRVVVCDRVSLASTADLKLAGVSPEAYQVIANRLRTLQR